LKKSKIDGIVINKATFLSREDGGTRFCDCGMNVYTTILRGGKFYYRCNNCGYEIKNPYEYKLKI
jgi:hypothetical protein